MGDNAPLLPFPVPSRLDYEALVALEDYYPTLISQLSSSDSQSKATPKRNLLWLDNFRHHVLPKRVVSRRCKFLTDEDKIGPELSPVEASTTYGWLYLDELQQLAEWKLQRGTDRPTLRKLITSNADGNVQRITRQAFDSFEDDPGAIQKLCTLHGVTPAIASLILSVAFPNDLPFLSDELYTWAAKENDRTGEFVRVLFKSLGNHPCLMTNWSMAHVKFNWTEYLEFSVKAKEILERVNRTSGVDELTDLSSVEIAAFVITRADQVLQASASFEGASMSSDATSTLEINKMIGNKRNHLHEAKGAKTKVQPRKAKIAKRRKRTLPKAQRTMPRRAAK
ncbi:hypothetical protein MMC10_006403 [Thelotrema lepadinum]|nr:hypothetical protein [Thelotrema lepadinum]